MSKFFTIQKKNLDKSQTKKDFDDILKTLEKPKGYVSNLKKETILNEQNEIYKVHDHSVVQEDIKNYVTKEDNPFEGKMNLYTSQKFFQ